MGISEHLHNGKMAAVSVRCMCTGSYAHIIALITLGILEPYTSMIFFVCVDFRYFTYLAFHLWVA